MKAQKEKILIVDDNTEVLEALDSSLSREFTVVCASSFEEAQSKVDQGLRLILLDVRLSETDATNKDGLALLELFVRDHPDVPVVMMTAFSDIDIAIQAMRL